MCEKLTGVPSVSVKLLPLLPLSSNYPEQHVKLLSIFLVKVENMGSKVEEEEQKILGDREQQS